MTRWPLPKVLVPKALKCGHPPFCLVPGWLSPSFPSPNSRCDVPDSMTERVSKRRRPTATSSRKKLETESLAAFILAEGKENMPCSRCYKASQVCRTIPGDTRCHACVRAKKSCDGSLVAPQCRLPSSPLLLPWPLTSSPPSEPRHEGDEASGRSYRQGGGGSTDHP